MIDLRGSSAPARGRLVRVGDSDRYFDYCLQPYEPLRSPAGKLRSESLLWNSLDAAAAPSSLDAALHAVQRAAGKDGTVWGAKYDGGRLWWELYFYEQRAPDTAARPDTIAAALEPFASLPHLPRQGMPFFMFSFDLLPETAGGGVIDSITVYLPYFEVQGGRSYKVSREGTQLDNSYRFLHPKTEIREILHEIKHSALIDFDRVPLHSVLWPELIDCNRICVAKKRFADAVYYSGIDVGQLACFLERMRYPAAIQDFVREHRADLDHLRFDVGIDYASAEDGSIRVTKSGYYGTL